MNHDLHQNLLPHRFAGIFSMQPAAQRAVWDEVLLEIDDCVVTPTLGAILPLWLLIIPRVRALNFALVEQHRGSGSTLNLIKRVCSRLGVSARRVIWFEHGPSSEGSSVGCGVDQAHLHILIDPPFSLEKLALTASEEGNLLWKLTTFDQAYMATGVLTSYLVMGSDDVAYYTENVEHIGSQFLRRQIAALVGSPEAWNYRTHPHSENVRRTIATLARFSTAAGSAIDASGFINGGLGA